MYIVSLGICDQRGVLPTTHTCNWNDRPTSRGYFSYLAGAKIKEKQMSGTGAIVVGKCITGIAGKTNVFDGDPAHSWDAGI